MKNVVLIPCWRRDDFLQVTLDYIQQANGADRNIYVFLLERSFVIGVHHVANNFPLEKIVHRTSHHTYRGNSFNVLEGYKLAMRLADHHESEIIYLIEEDIFIGKDFFDYHERVQSQFSNAFMVSGVKNQNDNTEKPQDPSKVYTFNRYQSLGVSWQPNRLPLILEHAVPEYYRSREAYLGKKFPKSVFGSNWSEQDGLINRLMEKHDLHGIYPCVPRAYHAGFVGYNRPGASLRGSLEERVQRLKEMGEEDMNSLAHEMKDIKQVPLSIDYGVKEFSLL
jgi:hypothetical protein